MMNIIPWHRHDNELSERGDRELEDFWNSFLPTIHWPSRFHLPEAFRLRRSPPMNLAETESHYSVSIELPGLEPSDIDVELTGRQLVVSGERKWAQEKNDKEFHRLESQFGSFSRTVTLPGNLRLDRESIEATFQKGILEIRIPKVEPPPVEKIPIRTR